MEETQWWHWCRLCAKEDIENNVNISKDMATATAIGKYFWVNIKPTDPTQRICQDCLRLIKELMAFTDRVNKVQAMLFMLQNAKNSEPIDPHELRMQYELLEDDFEHIVRVKSPKREVSFDENNILAFAEDESEQEDHFDESMPLQQDVKGCPTHNEIFEKEITEKKHQENILCTGSDKLNAAESIEDPNYQEDFQELIYENNDKESNERNKMSENDQKRNTIVKSSTAEQELSTHSSYNCRVCGKSYKNATSYRRHALETHKIEPDIPDFKCEKCNKIFPTNRQLMVHSRIHMPMEKKCDVPCQKCDKKFSTEAVMRQHLSSVHLNEKPFMCENCGLALASLASLNDHKITHSNEFPYECDICKKKFKHKTRLKTHKDTHNETEYECTQCGVRLNTKRTLKMHMLVHSEERNYKCNFCSAKFKRGKALKNHLILHLGLRPYKCNFCQKTFTNGSNCRSHKKRFHPTELAEDEAAGIKTKPIQVPKISELRERSNINAPSPIRRNNGGLSPGLRALLIAAEDRQKGKSIIKCKTHDETGSIERLEDCEETVLYEVIE